MVPLLKFRYRREERSIAVSLFRTILVKTDIIDILRRFSRRPPPTPGCDKFLLVSW